ncbi:MAG: hypothetical protein V9G98_20895 [Candidatus Competibacter sp.]
MTVPAGTVSLACWVICPTVNPASVIALVAALWVRPTTLGTVTGASPDTTRSTAEPGLNRGTCGGVLADDGAARHGGAGLLGHRPDG